MGILQSLSLIAVRQVAVGASRAAGIIGVEAVARFLGDHFSDNSHRLSQALQGATGRAWNALEIALAGESLWNRLDESDDRAFRARLRSFLDATAIPEADSPREDFRQQCLGELRAARKAGLLLSGGVESTDLARQAAELAGLGDEIPLVDREWQALDQVADQLRDAGHQSLARLVSLRPGEGKAPLIVLAVRYYFRRAVETDAELHRGLSFAQWQTLAESQQRGFEQLGQALDSQGQRLADLLDLMGEVCGAVLDLRREIAGQREQIQQLAHDVLGVLSQHQLAQRELRVGDSLSLRTDEERRLVRHLVARYRELPPDQRRRMPALLNAVGKMEVVTGNFDAARRDFEELVQIIPDEKAKAEACYNAYQAALESRQWDAALTSLKDAVALDSERFSPFPQTKYDPVRILGAGGFGVAFLCRDRHTGGRVVVKSLRVDGLDRAVTEVFTEARALEDLDHENIIRLRHCDYAGVNSTRPYLVMDYFEGVSLAEHVASHGPLSVGEVASLMSRVALALQKAHEKGICHRDVKPGNLLVRRNEDGWQIKLIDFGLALRQQTMQTTLGAASSYTQTIMGSSIAGTLDYAAPEQLGRRPGDKVGPHSDVYGLGKTACFALFGTTLPLARHWRGVSPELADLLGQCLADDPRERPASCKEVAERLAGNTSVPPPVAIPVAAPATLPTTPQPAPPGGEIRDPRPFFFRGALLGALAGLLGGSLYDDFSYRLTPLALLFVASGVGLVSGLGAVAGRRRGTPRAGRMTVTAVLLTVIGSLVLFLFLSLIGMRHHESISNIYWGGVYVLILSTILGCIWGMVQRQTASVIAAFGLIALFGIPSHSPAFLFAGALIGGILAAAFHVADPLRELDTNTDRFLDGILRFVAVFLPGEPSEKSPEATPLSSSPSIAEDRAAETPATPVWLAVRLGLILIACGLVAAAMGINAGATGFILDGRVREHLLVFLVAMGGISGGVALSLIRVEASRNWAGWVVLSFAVSCGLAALTGLLGWHVMRSSASYLAGPVVLAQFEQGYLPPASPGFPVSTAVVLTGLVLWGTALGLLAGWRRGAPGLGALAGAVLAGLVALQGWLIGHPDPAAFLAIPLGLLAGLLLWSGLRWKRLWLLRGLMAGVVLAAFIVTLAARDDFGLSGRAFGESFGPTVYNSPGSLPPPPALSSRGYQMMVASQQSVRLVDLNSGRTHTSFNPGGSSSNRVVAMAYMNDQPLCLIHQTNAQLSLSLFNVETRSRLGPGSDLSPYPSYTTGASHGDYFLIATPGTGGPRVHFYHRDGSGPDSYTLPSNRQVLAAALHQGNVLLGFDDGYVRLMRKGSSNELTQIHETMTQNGRIKRLGFSGDGRRAFALNEGQLMVWSVEDWKLFFPLPRDSEAPPTSAALSETGQFLLVGTSGGTIQLWDVERKDLMRTFRVGRSFLLDCNRPVEQVAFLPSSNSPRNEVVAVVSGTVVRLKHDPSRRISYTGKFDERKDSGPPSDRIWQRPASKEGSKPTDKLKP